MPDLNVPLLITLEFLSIGLIVFSMALVPSRRRLWMRVRTARTQWQFVDYQLRAIVLGVFIALAQVVGWSTLLLCGYAIYIAVVFGIR